jgi:rRNA biogenesis protein RRP5
MGSVNEEKNLVEMSLRTNAEPKTVSFTLGDLQDGQIVDGVVKRLEKYGIFIRIAGSNISGLCHKSEVRSKSELLGDLDSFPTLIDTRR